jgi:hypothetical protein
MAHGVRIKLFTGTMPSQSGMRRMILRRRQSNCLSPCAEELALGSEAKGCMVVKRF